MEEETFKRLIDEVRIKDSVINEVKEELARANVGEMTTTGGIKYLSRRSALLTKVKELVEKTARYPDKANETLNDISRMLENEE